MINALQKENDLWQQYCKKMQLDTHIKRIKYNMASYL